MLIDKSYPGIVDAGDHYEFDGDLGSQDSLEIKLDKDLIVSRRIKSGGNILVDKGIRAGGGIKAGQGISAGTFIQCTDLSARYSIFAGTCTWREVTEEETEIRCNRITSGKVKHGEVVKR